MKKKSKIYIFHYKIKDFKFKLKNVKNKKMLDNCIKFYIDNREKKNTIHEIHRIFNENFGSPIIIHSKNNSYYEYYIEKKKIILSVCRLDIGDYLIEVKNKPYIIIERKTETDLYSSIISKKQRYHDQKLRLIKFALDNKMPRTKIIYIIENESNNKLVFNNYNSNNNIEITKRESIIQGACINTMLRDGMTIYKTKGIIETAQTLIKILKYICKFHFMNNEIIIKENIQCKRKRDVNYIFDKDNIRRKIENEIIKSNVCTVKKKNINKKTIFINILCTLPGVSIKTAEAIYSQFNTIEQLMNSYNSEKEEIDKYHMLKDITIKKNKIGPNLSKNIYHFLTGRHK